MSTKQLSDLALSLIDKTALLGGNAVEVTKMNKSLRVLSKLQHGEQAVINGFVYTKASGPQEWKVSPYGLINDYERGSYFISSEGLVEDLMSSDMIRPPVFKQDTPEMQAMGILQGIEGHLINWQNGIAPSKKDIKNILMLVEHMKALASWLPKKWS